MAAAIPEVVETAASAGRAAEAGRAREIKPSRIPAKDRPPFGPEPERARLQRSRATAPAAPQQARQRSRKGTPPRGGQRARRTGRGILNARLPGHYSYQPVVLAEFVVAVVIVATGPIAKGGTPEAQTKGSASPYSVNTLKQLVAIGGVYFVLALVASHQKTARYAAWFGGLVLIALGMAELANGDLSAFFKIFGPTATAGGSTTSAAQEAAAGQLAPVPLGFLPEPSNAVVPTATGQAPAVQQYTLATPGVITTDAGSPAS